MTVSVKAIDALLPQTQCGECGYKGCLPYAEAIATDQAPINRCPPGGLKTIEKLANLLAIDPQEFLDDFEKVREPSLARIKEEECIGCTKCIQACPVDAIVGSAKLMHSIVNHECTGCGLCISPCPVDCIEMVSIPVASFDKNKSKERFMTKQNRISSDEEQKKAVYQSKRNVSTNNLINLPEDVKAKQAYILNALARVKLKQNHE